VTLNSALDCGLTDYRTNGLGFNVHSPLAMVAVIFVVPVKSVKWFLRLYLAQISWLAAYLLSSHTSVVS